MKEIFLKLNSTIAMVLFCFSDIYALPLTRTCYTPPENKIDMALNEEFIYDDEHVVRKDIYSLNLGIIRNTSLGLDFSLINYNSLTVGDNRPGDILFNVWHYFGDYFDGLVDAGFSVVFRIPTGPDAYTDEKYRNLSFGNNELKLGPVFSFNLSDSEIFVLNINYIFREGRGEKLYSGISMNLVKSETYKSCLGLNPFYDGSFLEGEKLKNDYTSVSCGIITSKLFPWVFFTELYYSARPYRGKDAVEGINIEADGVNPFLSSLGFKYCFTGSIFIQVSNTINLMKNDEYIKNTTQFSLNIFF
jgi:hypothetical protein